MQNCTHTRTKKPPCCSLQFVTVCNCFNALRLCHVGRTIVTSSGVGNLDDVDAGSVKHVRHYQVYRGMSPTTSSRLEVPCTHHNFILTKTGFRRWETYGQLTWGHYAGICKSFKIKQMHCINMMFIRQIISRNIGLYMSPVCVNSVIIVLLFQYKKLKNETTRGRNNSVIIVLLFQYKKLKNETTRGGQNTHI